MKPMPNILNFYFKSDLESFFFLWNLLLVFYKQNLLNSYMDIKKKEIQGSYYKMYFQIRGNDYSLREEVGDNR